MKKTSVLKEELKNGIFNDLLLDIYADEGKIASQTARYLKAIEIFESLYGESDVTVFSAPGRSEVGGNHTDHQHGEILAASINLDAIAIAKKTEDGLVRVVSGHYDEIVIDSGDISLQEEEKGSTVALIKGVLAGARNRGYCIGGFQAYVTSDVLVGAGLSSSAAFETVIGTIVSHLYNEGSIDAVTNAMIGQYAENVYFGKPCGLMDQMACSVGSLVHVDFANPENPAVEKVDFDLNEYGYSLCITDTKGSHADLTSDYAAVPEEMKRVAKYFGKEVLFGVSLSEIVENISEIRQQCGDRAVLRAIHFINENVRVRQEVEAIKSKRIDDFFRLVQASGDSSFKYLQNVFTTNDVQHQNVSLALAMSETVLKDGAGVCRVHGGGFAGTIQAFVKNEFVSEYLMQMNKIFGPGACSVLKIRKYGGIKVMG
ncbi:MAG: galactokinase family protein [Lachnospiraceae bacterium]|nr:galactokinase family protein [Lachnospiraceae bacterium]